MVNRRARTLALVVGILVATTAFTVLLGASTTSRLQASGTVAANARGAYDILVRPPGAGTVEEAATGLVRSDYLSGVYGGISMAQLAAVRAISGVEVAAPVALVGVVMQQVSVPVELPGASLDTGPQLYRVSVTRVTDRGLTRHAQAQSQYVYVTPNKLQHWGSDVYVGQTWGTRETLASGKTVVACPGLTWGGPFDVFAPRSQTTFACWSPRGGLVPALADDPGDARLHGEVLWNQPFLLAAVDPQAEQQLVGLAGAVDTGRALAATDAPSYRKDGGSFNFPRLDVPVLVSSAAVTDDTAQVQVDKLGQGGLALMTGGLPPQERVAALAAQPGQPLATTTITAAAAQQRLIEQLRTSQGVGVAAYFKSAPVKFSTDTGGHLTAVPTDPQPWTRLTGEQVNSRLAPSLTPLDLDDTWFRQVERRSSANNGHIPEPYLTAVGTFDASKLDLGPALSRLPTSYEAPPVVGGDARSRDLLKGQPLAPNENIAGYVQSPPLMLTTLASLEAFTNPKYFPDNVDALRLPGSVNTQQKPLSAIRVRVAGVAGVDPVSRERVRVVAQQLEALGLRVDITVGSSPTPVLTTLPAGTAGRPVLILDENWTKKGVAIAIISAVDTKSVALFVLILIVCALTVANASSAAVRSRRTELGVLACLGWAPPRLFALILLELAGVGLVAGLLGSLLALPIGAATGLSVSVGRAALAIPAATLLAMAAGAFPALRAARADPGAAVRPAVLTSTRARPQRRVATMALTNLTRVPARTAVGALSLAVGITALALLLGVTLAFQGAVTGTLLGDAVTLQVRTVDIVAVVATVALGVFSVADVLYLNIKERGPEFATLRAIGWDEPTLARLVTYEGLGMGLAGSLVGAGIGLAAVTRFVGHPTTTLVAAVAVAAAVGTLACAFSALVPVALLRRLPTAQTMAEE